MFHSSIIMSDWLEVPVTFKFKHIRRREKFLDRQRRQKRKKITECTASHSTFVGKSSCHPDDEFCPVVGKRIALIRQITNLITEFFTMKGKDKIRVDSGATIRRILDDFELWIDSWKDQPTNSLEDTKITVTHTCRESIGSYNASPCIIGYHMGELYAYGPFSSTAEAIRFAQYKLPGTEVTITNLWRPY